jgi:hypothetical protein
MVDRIEPGKIKNFKTEFTPKLVYATLYSLFEQFKNSNIERFDIEVYTYTCRQEKKYILFRNEVGPWSITKLNLEKLENLFAIIQEHTNRNNSNMEVYFNVIYFEPLKK